MNSGMNLSLQETVVQGDRMSSSDPNEPCLRIPQGEDSTQRTTSWRSGLLHRDELIRALRHVDEYLAERNASCWFVAIGGAVNVLALKSRLLTHDIDIYGYHFKDEQRILVDEAMKSAREENPNLGRDWINTKTQEWFPPDLHKWLTTAAFHQNFPIFEGKALTIFAAPWRYAFVAKIYKRWSSPKPCDYDLDDAIAYIDAHIRHTNCDRPVYLDEARKWAKRFGLLPPDKWFKNFLLSDVNEEDRHSWSIRKVRIRRRYLVSAGDKRRNDDWRRR